MTISKVANAMPILVGAFRPVFRAIGWACLFLLLLFWVIEAAYCVKSYSEGGWPALIGYIQGISQGHSVSPISWLTVAVMHAVLLGVTLLLAWLLRNSSRKSHE